MAFFMLSRCFLDFSVGVGAFVIGLSQISLPFLSVRHLREHGRFHFTMVTMTRSLECTWTKLSFGKASKSYSSRGFPVSQNLSLNP